jgi:hypothetical protein
MRIGRLVIKANTGSVIIHQALATNGQEVEHLWPSVARYNWLPVTFRRASHRPGVDSDTERIIRGRVSLPGQRRSKSPDRRACGLGPRSERSPIADDDQTLGTARSAAIEFRAQAPPNSSVTRWPAYFFLDNILLICVY